MNYHYDASDQEYLDD
jgi:hypothetical protein